ncbi:MAG TPA: rRNA maturation RNase YbeY [Verrucomicrobiae bacterium]
MKAPVPEPEPRDSVRLRNHCRGPRLDLRLLRRMIRVLLQDHLGRREFHLAIHFVGNVQITRLNEAYLRHRGVTDVIAFDYSKGASGLLCGEIFVCLPEAIVQARRFRTAWQHEVVRYIIHAILHLCGYDDRTAGQRRRMRSAENAALRQLAARYALLRLSK